MRAVVVEQFGVLPSVRTVPDPAPAAHGAVVRVEATGLCRSDWHAWQGHDPDVRLPHVPGHELAGTVVAVGTAVVGWRGGERVTVPFVCACGRCAQCASGNHQVCDHQTQPGFTAWGSFAEYVALDHADVNLVALPAAVSSQTAASLGCRFGTAFRAVVAVGRVQAGEWVAVHGCGGVGLSAVMIAAAAGARVVAVDVSPEALTLATSCGATAVVDGSAGLLVDVSAETSVAGAVREITGGGAHLSLDALGSPATCVDSVHSLRTRGRHVQVGLMPAVRGHPALPMDRVVAAELAILGSHGMAAHEYGPMLALIADGRLRPDLLVRRRIALDEAGEALAAMDRFPTAGMTVVDRMAIPS